MTTSERVDVSHYEGADRIYDHCEECKGWDEHWEIVGGPDLPGRKHHRRICSKHLAAQSPDQEGSQ